MLWEKNLHRRLMSGFEAELPADRGDGLSHLMMLTAVWFVFFLPTDGFTLFHYRSSK